MFSRESVYAFCVMSPPGYDAQDSASWYAQLQKPPFAPSPVVFRPVWTVLYVIIAVVLAWVCWRVWRGSLPTGILLPFAVNLISNLAFTPLQFGLRSNVLALLDILVVLGSLVWLMLSLWPMASFAAIALVPYLLWVSFATVLQVSVTYLNR